MSDPLFYVENNPLRLIAMVDDKHYELSALWLRERCQDDSHLDQVTQQRLFNPHDLPDDLDLRETCLLDDGRLFLAFSDGYEGFYDLSHFNPDFDDSDGLPSPLPWNTELNLEQVRFDFAQMHEPQILFNSLEAFQQYGFIVLHNVPTEEKQVLEVAQTYGYVRTTNFGRYFDVYSRPHSNDLAYRAVPLSPHTDNPYRDPVPGIQLLHCLVNETRGGLSTLVDSLTATAHLQEEDVEAYELLCTTPVRYRFVDRQGHELNERRCMINRSPTGRILGVHYSPRLDYLPLMDKSTTQKYHRARRKLGELFSSTELEIKFLLQAGELIMFDNSRILHGRTNYNPNEGERHLQGCYIDLDGPKGLYRELAMRLKSSEEY